VRWLVLLALAACTQDLDEQWQLRHDRIIAVRTDPPRLAAGGQASLTMLAGYSDAPAVERAPDLAAVVSPKSMSGSVAPFGGAWMVTAPDESALAAARSELGLPDGAPVPLQIGLASAWPHPVASTDEQHFAAVKTVLLGESGDNPPLEGLTINGAPPGDELVVPRTGQVPLYVEANDETQIVNWLTSAGTMHDFDLHAAYLTFEEGDALEGQLVLVLHDELGGVTWRVWPLRAE